MKRFCFIAAIVFLTACSGCSQADGPAGQGKVIKVMDGDSVMVRLEGKEVEVRLFGIDAPEHGQAYSDKARSGLKKLIDRQIATVEVIEKDRFGRSVAVLIRQDDRLNINKEMVRRGHAWVYRRYNDSKKWLVLEEDARDDERGLWAAPDPQPPWQWRRDHPRKKK